MRIYLQDSMYAAGVTNEIVSNIPKVWLSLAAFVINFYSLYFFFGYLLLIVVHFVYF